MLQGLRDSLKGTVIATVIVLFFIVPMVITGFGGSSWLGSVAGTDVASVNGAVITKRELSREVFLQKQRLLSQEGVDPSADYLKEENLRKPVLDRLTKKTAILTSAEVAGMAASDAQVNGIIVNQPEFQKDGKFDPQTYRTLLGRIGSSPALYKKNIGESVVLEQIDSGLKLSSFLTPNEKANIVSILHEKRSFYTIDIPSENMADEIDVTEEEKQSYYQQNQSRFMEPERVAVEYIELSVATLAEQMKVSEDEIKTQFEQSLAEFDPTPEMEVAHILIEAEGEEGAAKIEEVKAKLSAGDDFAALAKQYSDDAGSRESGGSLGTLVEGVFPENIEKIIQQLDEGEVSEPVVSEAGTHFVKVVSKVVPEAPTLADSRDSIVRQIKRTKAEDAYIANLDLLEELTFSAPGLQTASDELGIPVKTTKPFERTRGTGISTNAEIRNAAFSSEVLSDRHNSRVIELANNRAYVIRVKEHEPEHVLPFADVQDDIQKTLVQSKVTEQLRKKGDDLVAMLKKGGDPEKLAEELGYTYTENEDVTRSSPVSDPETRRSAFAAPVVEGETSYQVNRTSDGNFRVVAVTSQTPGSMDDVEAAQLRGLETQLLRETSRYEGSVYQADVIATAEVELY